MDRIPWKLGIRLGSGGLGDVFAATNAEGQRAAVKLMHVDAPEGHALMSREVAALEGLEHPGIATLLGSDVTAARPWYAMRLIGGGSLREQLGVLALGHVETFSLDAEGPTGEALGEPHPELLPLMVTLCRTLAWLHGEGIVHGDLKPDNVLLDEAGNPVLVDFGLAQRQGGALGREELVAEGLGQGSAPYVSPERLRGEPLDARADLYAVGCMLMELVRGSPPFVGQSLAAMRQGHLTGSPPELSADVHPGLRLLIHRLLAKHPEHRPGYADEVADALQACIDAPGLPDWPAPRPYLYRPPLVDRTAVLQKLRDASQQQILVEGTSGSGRTRVLSELALRLPRGQVWASRAGLNRPYSVLQPLVYEALSKSIDPDDRDRTMVASVWPELMPDGADPPTAVHQDVLLRAVVAWARRVAGLQPRVWLIDDADRLDRWSQDFLAAWSIAAPEHVRVVMTAEPLSRVAARLPRAVRLPIGHLDEAGTRRLIAGMLSTDKAPEGLVSLVWSASQGHPRVATELLRSALEASLLVRSERGEWRVAPRARWDELRVPEYLVQMARQRVKDLVPRLARAVGMVALLEGAVTGERLERLGIRSTELRRLVGEGLITDGLPVRLAWPALADAAREQLTPAHHGEVAQVLEATDGSSVLVAERWVDAGRWERARWHLQAGLQEAREQYDTEALERLLRLSLRDERVALGQRQVLKLELLFEVLLPAQRIQEALQLAREVEEADNQPRWASRALLARARALLSEGNLSEAEALCRASEAMHRRAGDTRGWVEAATDRASLYRRQGRLTDAHDLAKTVLEQCTSDDEELLALAPLASVAIARSELKRAEKLYRRAVRLADGLDHRERQALHLGNLAVALRMQGRLQEAIVVFRQSIGMLGQVGRHRARASHLANLGSTLHDLGHLEAAEKALREAMGVHRLLGNLRGAAVAKGNLAVILLQRGDVGEALEQLKDALQIHLANGEVSFSAWCLAQRGRALLHQGDIDGARGELDRSRAMLEDSGDQTELAHVDYERGRLERLTGNYARADRMLLLAWDVLNRQEDALMRPMVAAELGLLALATGHEAGVWLRQVGRTGSIAPQSEAGLAVSVLERAIRAAKEGRVLLHGQLADDLPTALREVLLAG